jgi:hypothetical protein
MWNSNETCIQINEQLGAKVLTKQRSHQIYNTIPKSKEWLTINYVVNVTRKCYQGFISSKERNYMMITYNSTN